MPHCPARVQAAAQQRRGRAGRVRPGVCYRLFSRRSWERMPRDTPPEIARAPLQGLVLDVKGILGAHTDVPALLARMITPPVPAALQQGKHRPSALLLACRLAILHIGWLRRLVGCPASATAVLKGQGVISNAVCPLSCPVPPTIARARTSPCHLAPSHRLTQQLYHHCSPDVAAPHRGSGRHQRGADIAWPAPHSHAL